MTPADLRAWQAQMGYTYDTAAAALGVSRGTYADWLAGRSRTTGKPIQISRLVALACAALAAGEGEWTPANSHYQGQTMDFKLSKSAMQHMLGGKQGPDLPYDAIKLRMEKGRLCVDFDNEGDTMLTFYLPHGWGNADHFSMGGLKGAIKVTLINT